MHDYCIEGSECMHSKGDFIAYYIYSVHGTQAPRKSSIPSIKLVMQFPGNQISKFMIL